MRTLLFLIVLLMGVAQGDGIRMTKDHRFVSGRESCYTLELTDLQVAGLEAERDGAKKLYAQMKLTADQKEFLEKKTGKRISEVLVFEDGWNDCSCCAQNIASRYEPDRIEVSDSYLVDDLTLRKWKERMKAVDEQQRMEREAAKKAKESK